MKNYYDILEVHPESGAEVIEASYKTLYKHYDPENFSTIQEKLSARIRRNQLNEAYKVLGNPKRKEKYDRYFKEKDGKVELVKSPNESLLLFFAVAVIIIILAQLVFNLLFPGFAKLTRVIATTPVFYTLLLIVLFGICVHYIYRNFIKK